VSKFTSDANQLALGVPAHFSVTVRNTGSQAVGAFQVLVTYAIKGSGDQTAVDGQTVDGLGAGQQVQLTFSGAVTQGGDYVFSAFADSADEVTESNEKDNARTLALSSVDLPNLAFDPLGVTTSTCAGGPAANVQFEADVNNIGKADISRPFFVGVTWSMGGTSSGTLESEQIASSLPAGIGIVHDFCPTLPGSGSYEVHVVLDPEHAIDESNENDNDLTISVDIP